MMKYSPDAVMQRPQQRIAHLLHTLKAKYHRQKRVAHEVGTLAPFVKPQGVVLDVGANFGYFAKEFARLHNGQVTVHAFEPISYNYSVLTGATGRVRNIHTRNVALSDMNGSVEISVPLKKSGKLGLALAHFGPETERDFMVETVKTVTIDEYVHAHAIQCIDLIKIDVEGAESLVLKGAPQTLARFRPALYIEIFDGYASRIGSSAAEVFTLLQSNDYKPHLLAAGKPMEVPGYCGAHDYLFLA